jgi:hypothetical protein
MTKSRVATRRPTAKRAAAKRMTAKRSTKVAAPASSNPVRDRLIARGWVPPPSLAPPGMIDRVRTLCLSFPDATARLSHGALCFFAGAKAFAKISDNHHSDGRFALIVAAPRGAQAMLVEAEPDHYYEPPYVRHLGWIGVRLDRDIAWSAVESLVESAYLEVAPAKIAARYRAQNTID